MGRGVSSPSGVWGSAVISCPSEPGAENGFYAYNEVKNNAIWNALFCIFERRRGPPSVAGPGKTFAPFPLSTGLVKISSTGMFCIGWKLEILYKNREDVREHLVEQMSSPATSHARVIKEEQTSIMLVQRIRHSRHWPRTFCLAFLMFTLALMFVVARWNNLLVQSFSQAFTCPMDAEDLATLDRTLRILIKTLEQNNVTYFMTSGTLLGSYRHHGRIPWDDDVDLMVNSSDKELVWKILTALKPDYGLFLSGLMDSPYHWCFYPRFDGRYVPFRSFRWPFVDLLFFVENSTHVWNGSPNLSDERWPRRFVFPLRRRPFDNFSLPAPCDTAAVLAVNFDIDQCRSRDRTHLYDLPMIQSGLAVPCSTLTARYPFVLTRHHLNSTAHNGQPFAVSETLLLGNQRIWQRTVLTGC